MKLNDHLPVFQFRTYHETRIRATPEQVYEIAQNFDFHKLFISRILLGLRSFPGMVFKLFGRSYRQVTETQGMDDMGFIKLAENPPRELVYGLVGRFWKLKPDSIHLAVDEFKDFNARGQAKAGWNFLIHPVDDRWIKLSTETRVQCMGAWARARFMSYWTIIRPFSGLIRREMLYWIKKDAEKGT